MSWGGTMGRLNKSLNQIEECLAVTTLLGASLLIFIQVVLRYLFNESIFWSEEAARYLIIWCIFIGSSIAVREKAHATVDAIVVILPTNFKKLFFIMANLAGIAFCIILIWSGTLVVSNVLNYGNVTPTLGISMAVPYLAVPVGGALMLYRFSQLLIDDIKNLKPDNRLDIPLEGGGADK